MFQVNLELLLEKIRVIFSCDLYKGYSSLKKTCVAELKSVNIAKIYSFF